MTVTGRPVRIIFHIDVNSAFLSWSAVRLISEGRQDVRLVPAVVSGDPSDRRSIVASKSIPAKRYGINTGEPLSMAMRKCPGLVVVHSDFAWYEECSRAFISVCRRYSPVLQQFSIDECFIDMSACLGGADAMEVARSLKNEIRDTLGFTVNVGVAHNKLLAKMAGDLEKPDKVHSLWEEEIPSKMWPLPVRNLLWVGRQTEARLRAYGVKTIGQLAGIEPEYLERMFGDKPGRQLYEYANGRDDSPVVTEIDEPKSYSNEYTMPADVTDPAALDRILFDLACFVAHRIRVDNFRARVVSLFVKDKNFTVYSKQCRLEQATDVTALLLFAARGLLGQIWDGRTPLRQLGLGLSSLTHENAWQLSLFEDGKMDFYRRWDEDYDRRCASGHAGRSYARRRAAMAGDVAAERGDAAAAVGSSDSAVERGDSISLRGDSAVASGVLGDSAAERGDVAVEFGDSAFRRRDVAGGRGDAAAVAGRGDVLEFRYPSGEDALAAAKRIVREHAGCTIEGRHLPDGNYCFELKDSSGNIFERHIAAPGSED